MSTFPESPLPATAGAVLSAGQLPVYVMVPEKAAPAMEELLRTLAELDYAVLPLNQADPADMGICLIDGVSQLPPTVQGTEDSAWEAMFKVAVVAARDALGSSPWPGWEALEELKVNDVLPIPCGSEYLRFCFRRWEQARVLRKELLQAREQLGRSLQSDDLTGLQNRRFFFQGAHRECARARRYNHPLTCLMISVDYLNAYNDFYGAACGDYILRTVAGIIRKWTRESDLAARFSGRKFVLLLPETDLEGATTMREKLQQVITETSFSWQDNPLPVSISIGESRRTGTRDEPGAPSTSEVDDPEADAVSVREEVADLLADADAALNVARKGARYPAVCLSGQGVVLGAADDSTV